MRIIQRWENICIFLECAREGVCGTLGSPSFFVLLPDYEANDFVLANVPYHEQHMILFYWMFPTMPHYLITKWARDSLTVKSTYCSQRKGPDFEFQHPYGQLTTICTSSSRRPKSLFWHPRVPGTHTVHKHTYRWNTHIHKVIKNYIYIYINIQVYIYIYTHTQVVRPRDLGLRLQNHEPK